MSNKQDSVIRYKFKDFVEYDFFTELDRQYANQLTKICDYLIREKLTEQIMYISNYVPTLTSKEIDRIMELVEKYYDNLFNISEYIIQVRDSFDRMGTATKIHYPDMYFVCDIIERFARLAEEVDIDGKV